MCALSTLQDVEIPPACQSVGGECEHHDRYCFLYPGAVPPPPDTSSCDNVEAWYNSIDYPENVGCSAKIPFYPPAKLIYCM
jgi:hypothetical protein